MEYVLEFKESLTLEVEEEFKSKIKCLYENEEFQKKIKKISTNKIVFSIGGDGTFLSAISKHDNDSLFIPINAGTLGFYTSWNKENLENLLSEKIYSLDASMLEISFNNKKYYCLNEATIINPINTQILDIYINELHLEHFRGTGLCICTPTGSTAYNKSLDGALMAPGSNLFEIVKIAPINNIKYRTINNPIILSSSDELKLSHESFYFKDSIITIDKQNFELKDVNEIKIKIADKKLKILTSSDQFWERVKKKFIKE